MLTVSAGRATINILPDDVLLPIFDFVRMTPLKFRQDGVGQICPSWWRQLVHVCQRWRIVIFASPKFLDLKLVCSLTTRVELLGIWPPLPIIIKNKINCQMSEDYDFDVAIVHDSRVCEINLSNLKTLQVRRLAPAMLKQFPALIHLKLGLDPYSRPAPSLPDGFLGGSAPNLQSLWLSSIRFPALPGLLFSATHLVHLSLWNIPHSGYISPEAIITNLAVLDNLESLTVGFESLLSCPVRENRHPLPPARTVLPALTRFEFKGVSKWLEIFMARIDAPLLDFLQITFFYQAIFDTPQLAQLMGLTTRFQTLNEAHVDFDDDGVQVRYPSLDQTLDERFRLRILCKELRWQLPSLAQALTSLFPFIYIVEHLYIYGSRYLPLQSQGDLESMQWLEISRLFSAVRNLYVSKVLAQRIAPALQVLIGESVASAFPALENLFVEKLQLSGPIQEAFGQFCAARQLFGHPVAVSHWNRHEERYCIDFDEFSPHSTP